MHRTELLHRIKAEIKHLSLAYCYYEFCSHCGELPPIDYGWLDVRVARPLDIQFHPWKESCYISYIDIGERICRLVVPRLVKHYRPMKIWNRLYIALCNINHISKYGLTITARLLTAASGEKRELLRPPLTTYPGDLVTVEGYPRQCYDPIAALHKFEEPVKPPTRKILRAVRPDLWVHSDHIVKYKGLPLTIEGKGVVKTKKLSDCSVI